MDDMWNVVVDVLAQQHGVIGHKQLRERNVSRYTVDRWVAEHRLERCAPRV